MAAGLNFEFAGLFAGAIGVEVERPETWLAELRKWRGQPASAAA
jgi:hypothetical protein